MTEPDLPAPHSETTSNIHAFQVISHLGEDTKTQQSSAVALMHLGPTVADACQALALEYKCEPKCLSLAHLGRGLWDFQQLSQLHAKTSGASSSIQPKLSTLHVYYNASHHPQFCACGSEQDIVTRLRKITKSQFHEIWRLTDQWRDLKKTQGVSLFDARTQILTLQDEVQDLKCQLAYYKSHAVK